MMYKSWLVIFLMASICFVQPPILGNLNSKRGSDLSLEIENEKSLNLLNLAKNYLKEQEEEKAIKTFLDAISLLSCRGTAPISPEERIYYDKALQIYMHVNASASPKETAFQLLREFENIHNLHPEYYTLNLLVCTAFANLGQFDKFFEVYYLSYPYSSQHYLTYKIQAILHIKLFEKGKTAEERERHRKIALDTIKQAIKIYPSDVGLYKIAILLSSPDQKAEVINDSLSKIINNNIIVPRHDISFFVQEAMDAFQLELAQKFVDKCREWYQYSRAINEIQEAISRKKNNE